MDRYQEGLVTIHPSGSGCCHTDILSRANLGVLAGISAQQIFEDIRDHIPAGTRKISDREIMDAVKKATGDAGTFTPTPRPQSIVADGSIAFQKIVAAGKFRDEKSLIESSPVRLDREPGGPELYKIFFENLFKPDDLLFIGDRLEPGFIGKTIRRAVDWLNVLWNGEKAGPFIIPNPLTGKPAPKESGDGETFRGNNNVKEPRYCVVEFDNVSKEDQIAFWSAIKLPVMALIDSGGKSIHAWLDVQKLAPVTSKDDWKRHVEQRLYDQMLVPLGVDAACKNAARLSRLPGFFREEKGRYQKLLWLRGKDGNG